MFEPIEDLLELPLNSSTCRSIAFEQSIGRRPTDSDNPPYTVQGVDWIVQDELSEWEEEGHRDSRKSFAGRSAPVPALVYAYVGYLLRTVKLRGR